MYTKVIEHVIGVFEHVNSFQVNFPGNSNSTVRIFCRCPANRGCTVIVEDADLLGDKADGLGTEAKERYCIIYIISSISENVIGFFFRCDIPVVFNQYIIYCMISVKTQLNMYLCTVFITTCPQPSQ